MGPIVYVDLRVHATARDTTNDLIRSVMGDPEGSTSLVQFGSTYYAGGVMTEAQWQAFKAGRDKANVAYLCSDPVQGGNQLRETNTAATLGEMYDHAAARTAGGTALSQGLTPVDFYVSAEAAGGGDGLSVETAWTLAEALANAANFKPGDTVHVAQGAYPDDWAFTNIEGVPGSPVTFNWNWSYIEGSIFLNGGQDLTFNDLSVREVRWDGTRTQVGTGTYPDDIAAMGVREQQVQVRTRRFIMNNAILRDGYVGKGSWREAPGAELHNALIMHTGAYGNDAPKERAHGHAIYGANDLTGPDNTKRFSNIVIVDCVGGGLHLWSSSHGTNNYAVENVILCNGSLVVGASQPAQEIDINNVWLYGKLNRGITSSIGDTDTPNVDLQLTDNIFAMRDQPPLAINLWDRAVVLNNHFYVTHPNGQGLIRLRNQDTSNWTWAGQQYHVEVDPGQDGPFSTRDPITALTLVGWKDATGLDGDVQVGTGYDEIIAGLVVRWFTFWPGHWAVAVYNFDQDNTVSIPAADIDFMEPGTTYRFHNAQDWGVDYFDVAYVGGDVDIDMLNRTVADLYQHGAPVHAATKEFKVFIVEALSGD